MTNSISKLIPRNKQKELENSFGHATGFGVVFVDEEGSHIGKGGNFCNFCTLINSSKTGTLKCKECNKAAIKKSKLTNNPSIYLCHAGLINIAIPLYLNGILLGALTAGQVRCTKESKYYKELKKNWPDDLDSKLLDDYFNEIPEMSDEEIESTVIALSNITDYIIQLNANRIYSEELSKQKEILFEVEKQNLILESELSKIKYSTLQKQIMPHFIFNVLNSISRLISLDRSSEASDMIFSFSNMLRYVFSYTDNSTTIRKELRCIQDYLNIQQIRFSKKFDYSLEVDDSALDVIIPYFSLQPLVENVFKHGFKHTEEMGRLKIILQKLGDVCYLEIIDNGIGIESKKLDDINKALLNEKVFNENVGIFNVYSRFKLMFPNSFTFNIVSKVNVGTKIKISFNTLDLNLF